VAEKVEGPVVMNIYPGADATFTLYEDEGINYDYEKGAYSTIRMDWDEESRSFTIGKRNGSFAGMEKTRTFSVNLMGETKSVEYNGKAVTVTF
jgi:alpha-D-xyloside xylohydrolase